MHPDHRLTRSSSFSTLKSQRNTPPINNYAFTDFVAIESSSSVSSQTTTATSTVPPHATISISSSQTADTIQRTLPPSPTLSTHSEDGNHDQQASKIIAPPCSPIIQGTSGATTSTTVPQLNLSSESNACTHTIEENRNAQFDKLLDIVRLGVKVPPGTYHKIIAAYEKEKAQNRKQRFCRLVYGLASVLDAKSE